MGAEHFEAIAGGVLLLLLVLALVIWQERRR